MPVGWCLGAAQGLYTLLNLDRLLEVIRLKNVLCLIGFVFVALASLPASASGLLGAEQMSSIHGGCGQCAYVQDLYCGSTCILSLQCSAESYCDSADKHEFCKKSNPGDTCWLRSETGGCGDKRENGTCTNWRCTGGNKIGTCPRERAQGNPCAP